MYHDCNIILVYVCIMIDHTKETQPHSKSCTVQHSAH